MKAKWTNLRKRIKEKKKRSKKRRKDKKESRNKKRRKKNKRKEIRKCQKLIGFENWGWISFEAKKRALHAIKQRIPIFTAL